MGDEAFRDDPATPGERVWRRGAGGSLVMAFCAVLLGLITVGLGTSGILLLGSMDTVLFGIFLLGGTALLGHMAYLMFRLIEGAGRAEIRIGRESVTFRLPGWRSLIHRPAAFTGFIPFADIVAIETRLESYAGQIERTSRLLRRDGSFVFLFDEGYVGTQLWSSPLDPVLTAMADAAQVPLRNLGMVEGRARPLMAWMAKPVPWDAPAIGSARERRLWSHAGLIGASLAGLLALVMIARAIAG